MKMEIAYTYNNRYCLEDFQLINIPKLEKYLEAISKLGMTIGTKF